MHDFMIWDVCLFHASTALLQVYAPVFFLMFFFSFLVLVNAFAMLCSGLLPGVFFSFLVMVNRFCRTISKNCPVFGNFTVESIADETCLHVDSFQNMLHAVRPCVRTGGSSGKEAAGICSWWQYH